MKNIIDIYDLLPEEINDVILKLTGALEIVKERKNTNSKFVYKENNKIICPHCFSEHIINNGHDKNKVQIFEYKNCKKKFTSCANTFFI